MHFQGFFSQERAGHFDLIPSARACPASAMDCRMNSSSIFIMKQEGNQN
jgi:hypothetical protein